MIQRRSDNLIGQIVTDAVALEDRGATVADRQRSGRWQKLSREWLAKHNRCEICGARSNLQVHHRYPYHLFPDLELDSRYWHALCRAPHDCHLLWGHLGDFKLFNPILAECVGMVRFLVKLAKAMLKASRAG